MDTNERLKMNPLIPQIVAEVAIFFVAVACVVIAMVLNENKRLRELVNIERRAGEMWRNKVLEHPEVKKETKRFLTPEKLGYIEPFPEYDAIVIATGKMEHIDLQKHCNLLSTWIRETREGIIVEHLKKFHRDALIKYRNAINVSLSKDTEKEWNKASSRTPDPLM